ncbi:MAG: DUF4445 domain-containing protein [Lachnospiraceae bacterium]|nr:DUF4445 domain-containing protein [Lachnospiraceae bacterium]
MFKFLEKQGHALDGGCRGSGHCGRCKVKYLTKAPEPAAAEQRFLTEQELLSGYRLACMHPADPEAEVAVHYVKAPGIDIVTAAPQVDVRRPEQGADPAAKIPDKSAEPKDTSTAWYIAIDLGTTTIAMQARTDSGRVLGEWKSMNPQRRFGNDVVSRMSAALEGHARELKSCVEKVLAAGIDQLVQKAERGEPKGIYLAGNTVMEHLLAGLSVEGLSQYPFRPVTLEEQEISVKGLEKSRKVTLLPGLSAFVGADLFAGVLACGMHRSEKVSLLVDLGTNGEMVLGNREKLMCTATAAGPAFEGGANGRMAGSDVIAMIAKMLEEGILDETGLLEEPWFDTGVAWNADRSGFAEPGNNAYLTQEDIRAIQMAKAAVYAGIRILIREYGIAPTEIEHVWLAGGFGYYLDVKSAAKIGLFPEELADRVVSVGNSSLSGSYLYSREERAASERIRSVCTPINLAEQEGFEDIYLWNMYLCPDTGKNFEE